MRIFITGDTHGEIDINKLSHTNFKEGGSLTKNDYMIIAGDFGLVFSVMQSQSERYWLKWLSEKRFTTLFIDGNHENFDRLDIIDKNNKNYICENIVGEVVNSIYHLKRGHIYIINGKKFWVFGGAYSIDKYRRAEGLSWWPREIPNKQEEDIGLKSLEEHNWEVDYIVTHTAPQSIIDIIDQKYFNRSVITPAYSLTKYLDFVKSNTKYKKWFIGHMHLDEQVDEKHILLYEKIIEIL